MTTITRMVGAAAAIVSAVVHLYLWFDGVKDQGTVGQLFVLNVVAGAVIAILLLTWQHWIPFALLVGFGAATLVCFLIAVNGELFGIHTGWSWYAWVAAVSEVLAMLAGFRGIGEAGHLRGTGMRRAAHRHG